MGTVESMYLVRLARDRSQAGRKVFADALSERYLADGASLSERGRRLMYDILHRIVRDIESTLRAEVSRRLAEMPDAPRELAKVLAADRIEVAYPILTMSRVLLDGDLVAIARNRSLEHQAAIAGRPRVSEAVCDALVELGDETVITRLLNNKSARISEATLAYLVEQSRRVDAFQEPILRRAELPAGLAARMVFWVSAALRQYILDNFDIGEGAIDDALEATAIDLVQAEPLTAVSKSAQLAAAVSREGELSPQLLLAALRDGELRLFVALFGRMTGFSERLIMDLLFEPGGEGLAIACKACGMRKQHFAAILTLVQRTRRRSDGLDRRALENVLILYDGLAVDAAKQVAQRWRRNVGYLAAIRDLKVG